MGEKPAINSKDPLEWLDNFYICLGLHRIPSYAAPSDRISSPSDRQWGPLCRSAHAQVRPAKTTSHHLST